MAQWANALGVSARETLLLKRRWGLCAAVILLVLMSPQYGATQEQTNKGQDRIDPRPWSYRIDTRPGRPAFEEDQPLGLSQEIQGMGMLQGGLLTGPLPARTGLTPYAEGRDRNETRRELYGAQLTWDRVLDSNLKLQYTLRSRGSVITQSGNESLLSHGAFDRSPTTHQGAALYRFKLTEKHFLTPAFSVNYDDAEGEAGKNRAADFKLTYSYLGDPLVLVVNAMVEQAGYDKKDPAFGKTTNDDGFELSASIYYTSPWGWSLFGTDAIKIFAAGTYYYMDSKSDVYKQESASGAAGVSLEW